MNDIKKIERHILEECRRWADWDGLSEKEQEETIDGYWAIAQMYATPKIKELEQHIAALKEKEFILRTALRFYSIDEHYSSDFKGEYKSALEQKGAIARSSLLRAMDVK